jgi:hypothetical protein
MRSKTRYKLALMTEAQFAVRLDHAHPQRSD